MKTHTHVQLTGNVVTPEDSFLLHEKGIVLESEAAPRAGIAGPWSRVQFDKTKYAVPYWCNDRELRVIP